MNPAKINSTILVTVDHYRYDTTDRLENMRLDILTKLFFDDKISPVLGRERGLDHLKILKENLGKQIKVYNSDIINTWNITEFGYIPAHVRIDGGPKTVFEGYFFILDKNKKLVKLYILEVYKFISSDTEIENYHFLTTSNIKAYIGASDKTTIDILNFLLASKLIQSITC